MTNRAIALHTFIISITLHLLHAQWSRDYGFYQPRADPSVCSADTCRLPGCFCAGQEAPLGMDPSVIPQIVMFTFDDAVNEQVIDYYKELFPPERVNPNGCPVTVTFFVSHNWTDYSMVKNLYDRGHEIASHSITHRMPQSWWRYASADEWEEEIVGQRENIVEQAGVPREEVTGMRAPFLDTGGDAQYEMMEQHDIHYDASFMTGPHDKGGVWPFTMDTVPSWKYCTNLNCPKDSHPRIWQVPLNRWVGIDGNGCSMVDACQQQPGHKGEALAYLWQNFNRHYYGNRAPVGVNMHATWFKTGHFYDAMKEFVKTISEMDDVYLVTVQQTLAWMKNPQTIGRAENFEPWLRSCSLLQRGRISSPRNDELPRFNEFDNDRDIPANRGTVHDSDSATNVLNDLIDKSMEYTVENDINDRSNRNQNSISKEDYLDTALYPFSNRVSSNTQRENELDDQIEKSSNVPSANYPRNFIPKSGEKRSRENRVNIQKINENAKQDLVDQESPVTQVVENNESEDEAESKSTAPVPTRRVPGRTAQQRPKPPQKNGPPRRPRPTNQEGQIRQQRLAKRNSAPSAQAQELNIFFAAKLLVMFYVSRIWI